MVPPLKKKRTEREKHDQSVNELWVGFQHPLQPAESGLLDGW